MHCNYWRKHVCTWHNGMYKKKWSQVTSGMIYWGVKTRCSLLGVCCCFLLQPGPVCRRASLMSKSLLWGQRRAAIAGIPCISFVVDSQSHKGHLRACVSVGPAAVWRYPRSNDRGLIMTQSCHGRAIMLFCMQTSRREFTGQLRVAPGAFRGWRCLLPREPAIRRSL